MEQNRHPQTFTFVNLNADSNVFSRISSNQRVLNFVVENNPLREFEEHTAIQRERNGKTVELNERKIQRQTPENKRQRTSHTCCFFEKAISSQIGVCYDREQITRSTMERIGL
jgi:hypothetical protein